MNVMFNRADVDKYENRTTAMKPRCMRSQRACVASRTAHSSKRFSERIGCNAILVPSEKQR